MRKDASCCRITCANTPRSEKKVVLAGLYNRLEVWDAAKWEEFKSRTEIASSDIAEKLG